MKIVRPLMFIGTITLVMMSFTNCASVKLQDTITINLGKVYYKSWFAGVKGGGSGINLYIPIHHQPNNIVLDSVYFKGRGTLLEQVKPNLFIGRFLTTISKPDLIMSNAPFKEYGNKVPRIQKDIPFELKDNECVLSYLENNKKKYYKISGILKEEPIFYPSAPLKKL